MKLGRYKLMKRFSSEKRTRNGTNGWFIYKIFKISAIYELMHVSMHVCKSIFRSNATVQQKRICLYIYFTMNAKLLAKYESSEISTIFDNQQYI